MRARILLEKKEIWTDRKTYWKTQLIVTINKKKRFGEIIFIYWKYSICK